MILLFYIIGCYWSFCVNDYLNRWYCNKMGVYFDYSNFDYVLKIKLSIIVLSSYLGVLSGYLTYLKLKDE